MPIVDFIFLSLTIFSSLLGLSRGFVKEFLSLTKWLVSIYISYISFEKAKIVLSSFLKDTTILDLIAAATIFILVFIILTINFNFLSKILSIKGMDFINKTLGFFDWIDPIKGKIPGPADAELKFISDHDPALYNEVIIAKPSQ